ncbi:MAG: hypothetical protein AAB676_18240 [Verrucomicrobiota bacterium]
MKRERSGADSPVVGRERLPSDERCVGKLRVYSACNWWDFTSNLAMVLPEPGLLPSTAPAIFATTHWSVVLAAGHPDSPQAAEALETLCRTYWYPLYA